MDLDNINDATIDMITEAVIKKMLWKFKQEEHQLNSPMTIGELLKGYLPFKETPEEFLLAEMARLHTLLQLYTKNEEFMKAAIIKRRLEIVENKLNNLEQDDNNSTDETDAGPQI